LYNKNQNFKQFFYWFFYNSFLLQIGGMMSIFLMGCFDSTKDVWCTVTKVHGGHDDKTLERLQVKLLLMLLIIIKNKFAWN